MSSKAKSRRKTPSRSTTLSAPVAAVPDQRSPASPTPEDNDAPTSSGKSAASQITSASVLACRPEFSTWAMLVGVNTSISQNIPATPKFDAIRKVKEESCRFPSWLTTADSPQFRYIPKPYQPFRDDLCAELLEAQTSTPDRFYEDEDIALSAAIMTILHTCCHTEQLKLLKSPTEMDRRHPIDSLASCVCHSDEAVDLAYITEQQLKLPELTFSKIHVVSTRADAMMYFEFKKRYKPYGLGAQCQHALNPFSTELPDFLRVLHCVFEYKRETDGSNQAIMAMVSALYQKKTLGLLTQFVFGVYQSDKNYLNIIAGCWNDNEVNPKINLFEIGEYPLDSPEAVVRLYLALRQIVKLEAIYRGEVLARENKIKQQFMANSPVAAWDPVRMQSISEDPNELDHQLQPRGDSNAVGGRTAMPSRPEHREAYQKVLSYLESISDVSEFLPIDQPPLPADILESEPDAPSASLPMKHGSENSSESSSGGSEIAQTPPPYSPPTPSNYNKDSSIGVNNLMGRSGLVQIE